ncbi:MAG: hypothetical protein K6C99_09150 [Lachnospiraceae bacterium]|nr:hypothetical protein [Lachnospiraceae bacterium]
MRIRKIKTVKDLIGVVNEAGFLPFFCSSVEGFSLEDHVSDSAWYRGSVHGRVIWDAWEWKGEVLRSRELIYGKFFGGKAGFISKEWFPDFCNYRRDGYDFDARFEDGLANYKDKGVADYLEENGAALTRKIKDDLNYKKGGNKGFETVITRLQMQTYVVPVNYEYSVRKSGQEFGWGNCRYDLAEKYWGKKLCTSAYKRDPDESLELMIRHLGKILPNVGEEEIGRFLK